MFARLAGGKVDYVRAHGALYNVAAKDPEHAQALVDATGSSTGVSRCCVRQAPRCGAWGGSRAPVDLGGVRRPGLHLRGAAPATSEPDALVRDADQAAARAVRMVTQGRVTAVDGSEVEIRAEALTVHSDTPGAVEIARRTRAALETAGVQLVPF